MSNNERLEGQTDECTLDSHDDFCPDPTADGVETSVEAELADSDTAIHAYFGYEVIDAPADGPIAVCEPVAFATCIAVDDILQDLPLEPETSKDEWLDGQIDQVIEDGHPDPTIDEVKASAEAELAGCDPVFKLDSKHQLFDTSVNSPIAFSEPVAFATDIALDINLQDLPSEPEILSLSEPRPSTRGSDREVIQPYERNPIRMDSDSSASNSESTPQQTSQVIGKTHLDKGDNNSDKRSKQGSKQINVVNATEVTLNGNGSYESLATAQQDKLTGLFNGKKVQTTYSWTNLTSSTLSVRGRPRYDIVEAFTNNNTDGGSDELRAPQTITTNSIDASNGNIDKLKARQINSKVLTKANFLANSAAAFTCSRLDGLFVAFNDARDGYQKNTDALVFLQGYDLISSGPLTIV